MSRSTAEIDISFDLDDNDKDGVEFEQSSLKESMDAKVESTQAHLQPEAHVIRGIFAGPALQILHDQARKLLPSRENAPSEHVNSPWFWLPVSTSSSTNISARLQAVLPSASYELDVTPSSVSIEQAMSWVQDVCTSIMPGFRKSLESLHHEPDSSTEKTSTSAPGIKGVMFRIVGVRASVVDSTRSSWSPAIVRTKTKEGRPETRDAILVPPGPLNPRGLTGGMWTRPFEAWSPVQCALVALGDGGSSQEGDADESSSTGDHGHASDKTEDTRATSATGTADESSIPAAATAAAAAAVERMVVSVLSSERGTARPRGGEREGSWDAPLGGILLAHLPSSHASTHAGAASNSLATGARSADTDASMSGVFMPVLPSASNYALCYQPSSFQQQLLLPPPLESSTLPPIALSNSSSATASSSSSSSSSSLSLSPDSLTHASVRALGAAGARKEVMHAASALLHEASERKGVSDRAEQVVLFLQAEWGHLADATNTPARVAGLAGQIGLRSIRSLLPTPSKISTVVAAATHHTMLLPDVPAPAPAADPFSISPPSPSSSTSSSTPSSTPSLSALLRQATMFTALHSVSKVEGQGANTLFALARTRLTPLPPPSSLSSSTPTSPSSPTPPTAHLALPVCISNSQPTTLLSHFLDWAQRFRNILRTNTSSNTKNLATSTSSTTTPVTGHPDDVQSSMGPVKALQLCVHVANVLELFLCALDTVVSSTFVSTSTSATTSSSGGGGPTWDPSSTWLVDSARGGSKTQLEALYSTLGYFHAQTVFLVKRILSSSTAASSSPPVIVSQPLLQRVFDSAVRAVELTPRSVQARLAVAEAHLMRNSPIGAYTALTLALGDVASDEFSTVPATKSTVHKGEEEDGDARQLLPASARPVLERARQMLQPLFGQDQWNAMINITDSSTSFASSGSHKPTKSSQNNRTSTSTSSSASSSSARSDDIIEELSSFVASLEVDVTFESVAPLESSSSLSSSSSSSSASASSPDYASRLTTVPSFQPTSGVTQSHIAKTSRIVRLTDTNPAALTSQQQQQQHQQKQQQQQATRPTDSKCVLAPPSSPPLQALFPCLRALPATGPLSPLEAGTCALSAAPLVWVQCPTSTFSLPREALMKHLLNPSTIPTSLPLANMDSFPTRHPRYLSVPSMGLPGTAFGAHFGTSLSMFSRPSAGGAQGEASSAAEDGKSVAENSIACSYSEMLERLHLWIFTHGIPRLLAKLVDVLVRSAPPLRSRLMTLISSTLPTSEAASRVRQLCPLPEYAGGSVLTFVAHSLGERLASWLIKSMRDLGIDMELLNSLLLSLHNHALPYLTVASAHGGGSKSSSATFIISPLTRYTCGVALYLPAMSLHCAAHPNAVVEFLPSRSSGPVMQVRTLRLLGPSEPVMVQPLLFPSLQLPLRTRIALDYLRSTCGQFGPRCLLPLPSINWVLRPFLERPLDSLIPPLSVVTSVMAQQQQQQQSSSSTLSSPSTSSTGAPQLQLGLPLYLRAEPHAAEVALEAVSCRSCIAKLTRKAGVGAGAGAGTGAGSGAATVDTSALVMTLRPAVGGGKSSLLSTSLSTSSNSSSSSGSSVGGGSGGGSNRHSKDWVYQCKACGALSLAHTVDEHTRLLALELEHTAHEFLQALSSLGKLKDDGFVTVVRNDADEVEPEDPDFSFIGVSDAALMSLFKRYMTRATATSSFLGSGSADATTPCVLRDLPLKTRPVMEAVVARVKMLRTQADELVGVSHLLHRDLRSLHMLAMLSKATYSSAALDAQYALEVVQDAVPAPVVSRGPVAASVHPGLLMPLLWASVTLLWGHQGREGHARVHDAYGVYRSMTGRSWLAFVNVFVVVSECQFAPPGSAPDTVLDAETGTLTSLTQMLGVLAKQ